MAGISTTSKLVRSSAEVPDFLRDIDWVRRRHVASWSFERAPTAHDKI